MPSAVGRPPSQTLSAPPWAPLALLAHGASLAEGRTGVQALQLSAHALQVRIELIRQARVSVDVQTYLIGDDGTGHLLLRELRDAAARGVRVRLLLDDLYTGGMTELLLGLAAHEHVELRLFNPYAWGRDMGLLRLVSFVADARRMNRRMHNKLMVADGVAVIVGGRNLADEYFFRSREGNFIDFEMLAVGALVPQLAATFDRYWNDERVFPVQAVARSPLDAAERRAAFDRLTAPAAEDGPVLAAVAIDAAAAPAAPVAAAGGFIDVEASCYADPPEKISPGFAAATPTVMSHFLRRMHEARSEIVLFSPYFVPGAEGLAQLREGRAQGIEMAVVTNALAASDEPLVSQGYDKYRDEMLRMGIRLYEISSARLHRDRDIARLLGSSAGRLHAKLAFVDRRLLLLGSMNLDPRSSRTNTELGVAVRSAEFTGLIATAMRLDERRTGVFEVRLNATSDAVEWVGRDADGEITLTEEPESTFWQRLKLKLISLVVPEDLL